jgi:glycosyltransferase involved in cell wall biosynthesis
MTPPLNKFRAQIASMKNKYYNAILIKGNNISTFIISNPRLYLLVRYLLNKLGLRHSALAAYYFLRSSDQAKISIRNITKKDVKIRDRFNQLAMPIHPKTPDALLLNQRFYRNKNLSWYRISGHIEGRYSLAIVNRGLALSLDSINSGKVIVNHFNNNSGEKLVDLPLEQREAIEILVRRVAPPHALMDLVSIVGHYPPLIDSEPASIRFILFFWEETEVPSSIISLINSQFIGVLVTANFVKFALRNSGCILPIFVIPIGLDHLLAQENLSRSNIKPSGNELFRFLHVSSVFDRKGADVLLNAYFNNFSKTDEVELLIKTFPNPHNSVRKQLQLLQQSYPDGPRVIIDERELDSAGIASLYHSAHAMVLPTRGEGFNLPAAEALALGLPLIVTGFGAHTDFCCRSTALLTPFEFALSRSHVRSENALWIEPNVEALGLLMQHLRSEILADSPELEARRIAGSSLVRQIYTAQRSAEAILASTGWLRERLAKNSASTIHRIALISPWNTRCGIAEYSHKLMKCLPESFILQIFCDSRTESNDLQHIYHPTWTIGQESTVLETLEKVKNGGFDAVVIQHQPSLFELSDTVCQKIYDLHEQNCIVLIELHSTQPFLYERKLTKTTVTRLRSLDRVIVHQTEDLNHMLSLGLADNLMLLPHGVVQPPKDFDKSSQRASWNFDEDDLVIASFGFILAHKGLDSLVESIIPLTKVINKKVKLLALNSVLDERSLYTLNKYKKLASSIGVDHLVTWASDFRPIEECVSLLGMADYIIYPYEETRESASGAVTIGLASLKPVLVSPLSIFADVAHCTYTMSGRNADDIVQAIINLEENPHLINIINKNQRDWLSQRDWDRISRRFFDTLTGLIIDNDMVKSSGKSNSNFDITKYSDREPSKLFVDISELFFRDAKTGIQRVVRSILSELIKSPPAGFQICPVYCTSDYKYRYTAANFVTNIGNINLLEGRLIDVRSGDIFLGLDLTAHLFPGIDLELKMFRLLGVRIYYVVYDIIPLIFPHFSASGMATAFSNWVHSLSQHADGLICISEAVSQDVRSWLKSQQNVNAIPPLHHFSLGSDIESSSPSVGSPHNADDLIFMIGQGTTFLIVGTLEPRKGQAQVLAAFEEMWSSGSQAKLVLVGKQGWMVDKLANQLRQHRELGDHLYWLEDISDEFLTRIYSAAHCLIAASEAEGFGLPLIEAARHGLPIVARDIPIFREVAGAHAMYFSGLDPVALAEVLLQWMHLEKQGQTTQSGSIPWLTWKQSTNLLLNILLSD